MINMEKEDFYNLVFIGSGTFGSVYVKDNMAIKLYHSEVKSQLNMYSINPNLLHYQKRIKKLLQRRNQIHYTDLIHDILCINGQFRGVVGTFYDGYSLNKIYDTLSFDEKKYIIEQVIRNAEELTDHYIYPTDYKANNIQYTSDKQVKIIDLDDCYTKVATFANPFLKKRSTFALKMFIISFFNAKTHQIHTFNKLPTLGICRENKSLFQKIYSNYNDLKSYLTNIAKPHIFAFISIDQPLKDIIRNIKAINHIDDIKIVLCCNGKNIPSLYLCQLEKLGFNIYDIVINNRNEMNIIKQYLTCFNTDSYYILENDEWNYHQLTDKPKVYKLTKDRSQNRL